MAKIMLKVSKLPNRLELMLYDADELIQEVGGTLCSRQAVCIIVMMYKLQQRERLI